MNGDSPGQRERRKPRLVPVLALMAAIAAGLGAVAAFVLFKVQYDILQLADHASQTLLPDIQTQVRTALNLDRLRVFGEIVHSSPEPYERREALLAMRILTMNAIYEQDVFTNDQINRVYRIVERMAAYRTRQDAARQRIQDELLRFYTQVSPDPPELASAGFGNPGKSHDDLAPKLYKLLQSALYNPRSDTARQEFSAMEQELARRSSEPDQTIDHDADPTHDLLQALRIIFNTEDELHNAWVSARALIDHLAQHISIDAAVSASNGNAEIARNAKSAMVMVALAMGGLILLFIAGIHFVRRVVVEPIIRVTRNLEQVKATHRPALLRREWLRELDNIAIAVEAFGAALARISQYTIDLEQEIAERQKAQAQLLELATTDSLTGLHNRRYFMESASQELDRARRYQTPLSLLLLDADHFKSVNDRYGHPVGDQALQTLAIIGRRVLREVDLFARIGGEEFAILLPQTDHAAARNVAERLRQAIIDQPIATEDGPLHLTVSLGLTNLGSAPADLDELLRRADVALYQAKQNGRNRVESILD